MAEEHGGEVARLRRHFDRRPWAEPGAAPDRADRRQTEGDTRLLRESLREHGAHAAARLRVMRQWAADDVALAERRGAETRAEMKRARVERLDRVIARLDAGERGAD